MVSHTINFEFTFDGKEFLVSFDSESRERNLLMSVSMDEWPLDTCELRTTNPGLYNLIKIGMKENADKFWATAKIEAKRTFSKLPDLSTSLFEAIGKITKDYAKKEGIEL